MLRRERWWARELERQNRAHAEERAHLIETIAHLAGKPVPAHAPPPPPTVPFDPDRYTARPELDP